MESSSSPSPTGSPLFGLSFVTLTFDDATDAYRARQQVSERILEAELPEGVKPSLGPMATPIGEVYRYTLDSKSSDPMTLRTLQDWTVRPQLLQVPGVADVVSYGGLIKEIHVQPNPTKMAALGVGLTDIFTALTKASANATGGYVERGSEMFVIRSLGIFHDMPDLELVRVASHEGVPVTVKHRHRHRGLHAAPGHRHARRQRRRDRGHRPHAPRREPHRRARRPEQAHHRAQ